MFITFEGGEHAGKTTQIHMLKDALQEEGYEVTVTQEPNKHHPFGKALHDVLETPKIAPDRLAFTDALVWAAARAEHYRNTIAPELNKGKIVLCDRFLDSSVVYQGWADNLHFVDTHDNEVDKEISQAARHDMRMIYDMNLHAIGGSNSLPNLTFVFSTTEYERSERKASRENETDPKGYDDREAHFHERIESGYQQWMQEQNDERFVQIPMLMSIKRTHYFIGNHVLETLDV